MASDDQLVTYILKAREKGRSDEQIARSLYSVGWRKERVDAAFIAAAGMNIPGSQQAPPEEEGTQASQHEEEEKEPEEEQPQKIVPRKMARPASPPPIRPAQQPLVPPPVQQPPWAQSPPVARAPVSPQPAPQNPQPAPLSARQAPVLPMGSPAPIDLPHGPEYEQVKDESQVQNPAFPKVAGGVSKLDMEFIVRVVIFMAILGAIIWGYLYLTSGAGPIIVSS